MPFQGDLDGDGKTDLILYRPSTATWFVQQSSKGFVSFSFGGPGDIPVVARLRRRWVTPSWACIVRARASGSSPGTRRAVAQFGGPDDIPLALRNYNGTGADVITVYRPGTGQWFIAGQGSPIGFGGPGDVPVPMFNVNGDGRDSLAVYRPSTSQWFIAGQGSPISFGGPGDVPVDGGLRRHGPRPARGLPSRARPSGSSPGTPAPSASAARISISRVETTYSNRLSGIQGSGVSASSVKSLDFATNALALSVGSTRLRSTPTPVARVTGQAPAGYIQGRRR